MFGYGDREDDPVIRRIAEDFGDRYGSDLSMWVTQHYKDTGYQIKYEDITDDTIRMLRSKYPNY